MTSLTPQEAQEALAAIHAAAKRMRRVVSGSAMAHNLMIWGVVWMLGFAGSACCPTHAGTIWQVLVGAGLLLTVLDLFLRHRRQEIRSPEAHQIQTRLLFSWGVLILWALGLALLLPLRREFDQASIPVALTMMGYVLMGIWLRSGVLVAIGVGVTVVLVVGRIWFSPRPFMFWMALFGGGGLFFPGLYVKLRWK